jgi:hypothetical protein
MAREAPFPQREVNRGEPTHLQQYRESEPRCQNSAEYISTAEFPVVGINRYMAAK